MANLPISQLPELLSSGLTPSAEYVVAQNGVTYKIKESSINPFPKNFGLFSQTGNSITVSGTTTESTLIDGGVGTLSVPASGFTIGDSFSCTVIGHLSAKNNDTLTIRIKSGSVILGQLGPITMSQATNKHFHLKLTFTIRSIGSTGVASIISGGMFTYSKDSSLSFEGEDFTTLNNTTFDTTINNTLDVTAQWNTNDPANSIYSEVFVLNKIY
jgi:hypothetical protein